MRTAMKTRAAFLMCACASGVCAQTPDFFEENSVPTPLGISVTRFSVADLDGDGVSEWILASKTTNQVFVLKGNADGSYQSPCGIAVTLPETVIHGDWDANGVTDLLVLGTSAVPNGSLLTFFWNCTGFTAQGCPNWQAVNPVIVLDAGLGYVAGLNQIRSGKVNNDSIEDFVFAGSLHQIVAVVNTQLAPNQIQLGIAQPIVPSVGFPTIDFRDLDADGDDDLIYVNVNLGIQTVVGWNQTAGSALWSGQLVNLGADGGHIRVGRFVDHPAYPNHLDIVGDVYVSAAVPRSLRVHDQFAPHTFGSQDTDLGQDFNSGLASFDRDLDGFDDLLFSNGGASYFFVLSNTLKSGLFQPATDLASYPIASGMGVRSLRPADSDFDGDLDLIVTLGAGNAPNSYTTFYNQLLPSKKQPRTMSLLRGQLTSGSARELYEPDASRVQVASPYSSGVQLAFESGSTPANSLRLRLDAGAQDPSGTIAVATNNKVLIKNWNHPQQKFELVASFPLSASQSQFSVTIQNIANYRSPTGRIELVVVQLATTANGNPSVVYRYELDRVWAEALP